MRLLVLVLAAAHVVGLASLAAAQQPAAKLPRKETPIVPSTHELKTTPEMWFYQQELSRYDEPANAVRRNAELDAMQRKQRIAAMKWYGYSAARPTVNPTPWGSSYNTTWTTGSVRVGSWAAQQRVYVVPR